MNNLIKIITKFILYISCALLILTFLREQPLTNIKLIEFKVFSSIAFAFMILSGFFIPIIYSCIKDQYKIFYKSIIFMSISFTLCFTLFYFLFFDSFDNEILIILTFGLAGVLFCELTYWLMFNKQSSKV